MVLIRFLIQVIAGLWVLSVFGNCFNFLTLFYTGTCASVFPFILQVLFAIAAENYTLFLFGEAFVVLHTVPFLYDKYEAQVDAFAEKAYAELKKHYTVLHTKYLSKIPTRPLKDKKLQ